MTISPTFLEHEQLRLFYYFEAREEKRRKKALANPDASPFELRPVSPSASLYADLTLIDALEQTNYFKLIPLGTQVRWADRNCEQYANLAGEVVCDTAPLLRRDIDPDDDEYSEEFKKLDAEEVAQKLKANPPKVAVRWVSKDDFRIWHVSRHLPTKLVELTDVEAETFTKIFYVDGNRAKHYDLSICKSIQSPPEWNLSDEERAVRRAEQARADERRASGQPKESR